MLEELKTVGFSENEAKVYFALLKMGECTIGPLEGKLGLFKQSIYNTLDSLIDQNYVKVIKKNNRKYFVANDPDTILEKLQVKEKKIRKLLPELHAMSGIGKYVSDIKVYGGVKSFQLFHQRMLKNAPMKSELKVIGAGGDEFLKITRQRYFFTRYENLRINKKISHRLLMYKDQRAVEPEYLKRKYVEVKFLPDSYNQPIATQIWPDRVAVLLFGDEPQIVEIKSAKITEGFQNYFEALWKMGKE